MIPEIGHFSLILALGMALCLAVVPLVGAARGNIAWMRSARTLAPGLLIFVTIAFACLAASFAGDDFSVAYVAHNSNSHLPWYYKIGAVWGGHEGSLLLWVLILSVWTFAVAVFSRDLPLAMRARVLAVMGLIAVGFLIFLLFTSNPFERQLPFVPSEGTDLNPLLQDPGLIMHPPMLYLGYVGFSVVFAFAIAALLGGRLDTAWARWSRPWTNMAWAFLTVGITLGSWWAYYELGWGGWWFWDPVENASFMPWLAGTALVHTLAVTEKRGLFKSWTVLLAIFTFSLSLLGTFLVRSGVLTSVHAFATDPARGLFILVFLAIVIGGSLLLYALRAPTVSSAGSFRWLSREFFLLINNVVLVVAMLTVLFGTLFPLLTDALGVGKYSVGPPYFDAVFVPLMAILIAFMGAGPMLKWQSSRSDMLKRQLLVPAIAAVVVGLLFPSFYGDNFNWKVSLAVVFATWLVTATLADLAGRLRNTGQGWRGFGRLSHSYRGMLLAHIGFAVAAAGVCLTSQYSVERDVRLALGQTVAIGGYRFRYAGHDRRRGPNYLAEVATLEVSRDGREVTALKPEKRHYTTDGQIMTEAGIRPGPFADLYAAMGGALDNDAWSFRLQVKPFVRWIWAGGVLIGIGGVMTVFDRRYRRRRRATGAVPAIAGVR